MKKYWLIFRLSWQNALTYRLNFIMWRLRSIIGFLASYLFWLALVSSNPDIAGYNASILLTYIFIAGFLRNLVFSNVSYAACMEIASGDLSNFLIKPVGYFKYWLTRDLADKALNLIFFAAEITLFYFLLKPAIIWPQSFFNLFAFVGFCLLATLLFFFISFLISAYAFWHPEHNGWPLRFLFTMFIDVLSGASIPLDVFPPALMQFFRFSPFSYLVFYPNQIWLNRTDRGDVLALLVILLVWLFGLFFCFHFVWRQGLKKYQAYGR